MTTLPPPKTKEFSSDSLEKKIYSMVEEFKEFIPVTNDRYRLAYCLYKFAMGEGDDAKTSLKSAKIVFEGISLNDLSSKLDERLKAIQ